MKLTVIAHVNSKKPRIEKDLFGDLHVYISEPPLEGRANEAIKQALSEYLKISKSKLALIKGQKSKIKIFDID